MADAGIKIKTNLLYETLSYKMSNYKCHIFETDESVLLIMYAQLFIHRPQ